MKLSIFSWKIPEKIREPQDQKNIQALLICSGVFSILSENQSFELKTNHLILIPPGYTYHIKAVGDCIHKIAKISINFMDWNHPAHRRSGFQFPFGVYNRITIFKLNRREFLYHLYLIRLWNWKCRINGLECKEMDNSPMAFLWMRELMNLIHSATPLSEKISNKMAITVRFYNLLTHHFRQQHSVGFYAANICVTPGYLNKALKKLAGCGTKKLISYTLLQEARWMLQNPKFSIIEISDQLGFSSVAAFGKFFKKYQNVSPAEYRTQKNSS